VGKTVLPMAAGALGNLVVPGLGGIVGSKLGSMAGNLFEIPVGEMGEQEAEFEVARRYVRLAATAARHAATAPPQARSQAVARAALLTSARRHAPGLARRLRGPDGRFVSAGPGRRVVPGQQGSPARARYGPSASTVFASGRRVPSYPAYAGTSYAPTPSYAGTSSAPPSYAEPDSGFGSPYGGSGTEASGSGPGPQGCNCGRRQQGRWYRRGSRIVLAGA
jgi:hypothetical protein